MEAWETQFQRGATIPDDALTAATRAFSLYEFPTSALLCAWVEDQAFGLVVVDTLGKSAAGADQNSSDMATVSAHIGRLVEATHGGAVVVVAHTGKTDADARGYSGIEDDADTVWHCKRPEESLESFTLTNRKMKDGPETEPLDLRTVNVRDSLVVAGPLPGRDLFAEADTRAARVVLNMMLRGTHDEHVTPNGLWAILKDGPTPLGRDKVREALYWMSEQGVLLALGAGRARTFTLGPRALNEGFLDLGF